MRKKIGMILVLCLMLSTLAVSADTIVDTAQNQKMAGELLKEVNIIKGTAQGLEEENNLTREQAIVILLRMLDLEKEVDNFQSYLRFSDVPDTHWSAKYVNYAYSKGITNGIGGGKFGLGQLVNKKSMATYMLRALGYTADWSSEDIMGKARKLGITTDMGEGMENITRGQSFIYMANTLTQPKNNGDKMLLETLGLSALADKLSKAQFQTAQGQVAVIADSGQQPPQQPVAQGPSKQDPSKQDPSKNPAADPNAQPQQPNAPKEFVTVKLPPTLKPIAAKTYLYDELDVKFNTLVSFPQKSNFEFTVEGRRIEDAHYNISPGGDSIRFKFSDQNLHGKTIVCNMKNLKASDGKSEISDATITAQFKDFIPIKFVKAEVLDKKSFRGIMSVNVMPPDGHKYGTEGHEVTSDGKLMWENVDYQLGWGGKEFKVVFKSEQVYPKQEATLKVWGYMTAPYHKFMDDADEIKLDFSIFEKKEIPLPEVKEPEPAVIVVEPPKMNVVEVWKEVEVVEMPKREIKPEEPAQPEPAQPQPPKKYEEVKKENTIKAQPIVVVDQYYDEYMVFLYTDGKVGSVEGLKLVDKNQKEIPVKYETFENSFNGNNFYGFKVIVQGAKEKRDFGGYEVFVEQLYESTNQVYTGPFSIKINQIIN